MANTSKETRHRIPSSTRCWSQELAQRRTEGWLELINSETGARQQRSAVGVKGKRSGKDGESGKLSESFSKRVIQMLLSYERAHAVVLHIQDGNSGRDPKNGLV